MNVGSGDVSCGACAIGDDHMTRPEPRTDSARVVRAIHLLGDADSLCDTSSTGRMPISSRYERIVAASSGGIVGIEISAVSVIP